MKRIFVKILLQSGAVLFLHEILVHFMADKNIMAGIFCPGSHLPFYSLPMIGLFIVVRMYVVLLPGFVFSHIAVEILRRKRSQEKSGACLE